VTTPTILCISDLNFFVIFSGLKIYKISGFTLIEIMIVIVITLVGIAIDFNYLLFTYFQFNKVCEKNIVGKWEIRRRNFDFSKSEHL
jgi:prepilin-type N-terminal cleavage/methylation domain-containing protein